MVLSLVGAVGALTFLGFLDRFHWLFEIVVAFRIQYAGVAVALALAALVAHGRWVGLAALGVAAINLVVVAPSWFPVQQPELAGGETARVLVANVEAKNDQHAEVAALVRELDPDVVGLIEYTPSWVRALEPDLGGFRHRILAPQDDPYGIGLYSRRPLGSARIEYFPPEDGPPTVVTSLSIGDEQVTLLVTHVHTSRAKSLHTRHIEAIADARPRLGEHLVVCGDFNTVSWSAPVRRLKEKARLRDAFAGRPLQWSWPTWNPLFGIPIDHCLISEGVVAVQRERARRVGSDHRPILLEIGIARR